MNTKDRDSAGTDESDELSELTNYMSSIAYIFDVFSAT